MPQDARPSGHLNVFTIAAGAPFLETLADRLLGGDLIPAIAPSSDPLTLSAATIYVPSRRSARALEAVLAGRTEGKALLLPRILPLGDPAEIEERLPPFEGMSGAPVLPEAVSDLDRRLLLMRLIDQWRQALSPLLLKLEEGEIFQVARSRADAFALAGDLADLIDEMIIEEADWKKLPGLVDLEQDQYWKLTAQFLEIAGTSWPRYLKETGQIDAAERRQRLIGAETERLIRDRPADCIVVAGSTGSQPATAGLMRAVASLPNGAVVLPGLDRTILDQRGWDAIALEGQAFATGLTHPQAGLKRVLARMGIHREDVQDLPASRPEPQAMARHALLSKAMRPAETTDDWLTTPAEAKRQLAALDGVTLIDAADEREEALAIAIAIRERLEKPDGVIALVTPDRNLAAHVIVELNRWGILAQDSAGRPLPQTPAGRLSRLILDALVGNFAALPLLALLRDPAMRLGLNATGMARATDALEIVVLRGQRISGGIAGMIRAASHPRLDHFASRPARRLQAECETLALPMLLRLKAALVLPDDGRQHTLADWARWHKAALLACISDDSGTTDALEHLPGAAELAAVFEAIGTSSDQEPVELSAYRDMFEALIDGEIALESMPSNSRVKILGPLEARLLPADSMILGGLNEGVWPPQARLDAFLNRRMRGEIGLSPPERRIGQSAHDFLMFAGTPDLVLSRAGRSGEKPSLRSRFLERLQALIGKDAYAVLAARGDRLKELATIIDQPKKFIRIQRPVPVPPLERRPKRISITDVEKLIRDPYAIHAEKILGLDALPEIDISPDATLRGTIFHGALADVVRAFPVDWPRDGAERIVAVGNERIDALIPDPVLRIFWQSQIAAIARFMNGLELRRRQEGLRAHVEIDGSMMLSFAGGETLELRGRADRIDQFSDGSISIIDYKSGVVPTSPQVISGLSPQLLLTAVMVWEGAFAGVPKHAPLRDLTYIKVGKDSKLSVINPNTREKDKEKEKEKDKDNSIEDVVRSKWPKIRSHLERFFVATNGYESRRIAFKTTYIGNYDHLARVKEWSIVATDGEDAE